MNLFRRVVGIVLLVIGAITIYFDFNPIKHGNGVILHDFNFWVRWVICWLWIFFSATTKLTMVAGKRTRWINITSIALWFMNAIVPFVFHKHGSTGDIYSPLQWSAYALFLISWLIFDIVDLIESTSGQKSTNQGNSSRAMFG